MVKTIGMKTNTTSTSKALQIFRMHGGLLRTAQAMALGIHPETLYRLRDEHHLVVVSRGLFRLADMPQMSQPDLVAVASRIPDGVVCLISALSFHGLTTEIPHEVFVALPPGAVRRRVLQPPVRIFQYSGDAFSAGIEVHDVDGVKLKVYSAEKSVVDCFRFRNKVGLSVAVEALRIYRMRQGASFRILLEFARMLRVERVIMPYLEALQ